MMRMYKDYVLAGLIKCKDCNSSMTPCHTNKNKHGKIERYYYYRCTKTFKRDWDSCTTRQVSANRLENYIFQNLERASLDRHYIDSLIFKLNNSQAGDRIGLEPSQVCFESAKISPEIFVQTLQHFAKGLFKRKGIEKNLWAKQFIKRIDYSKEEISITLYYKVSCEEENPSLEASGWVGAAAGRNSFSAADKKLPLSVMIRVIVKIGSPARTRTSDLVVTSTPKLLSDLDYLFSIAFGFRRQVYSLCAFRARLFKGLAHLAQDYPPLNRWRASLN